MTRKFGLLGYPLGHSFSRGYHTERFAKLGIDAAYDNYELDDIGRLPALVASEPALEGLNVTIPYKERVLPYLDELDVTAQRIGAVNVIHIVRDGGRVRMVGYNSDYIGFARSIAPLLGTHHERALVLGTGGASKAVSAALRDMGIAVCAVSRHPSAGQLSYCDLTQKVMSSHKVIVNATPLGMYPNVESCPDIPYDELSEEHLCFDVVYNPEETLFMRRAAERGAVVSNGMKMLYGQADAAWEIWNG